MQLKHYYLLIGDFFHREYELVESESQWKEVLRQTNAGMAGVQVSVDDRMFFPMMGCIE